MELKQQLTQLCKIRTDRLLLAELAYSQIKQTLSDDARINPDTATELYAYEVPDNTIKLQNESATLTNDLGKFSKDC